MSEPSSFALRALSLHESKLGRLYQRKDAIPLPIAPTINQSVEEKLSPRRGEPEGDQTSEGEKQQARKGGLTVRLKDADASSKLSVINEADSFLYEQYSDLSMLAASPPSELRLTDAEAAKSSSITFAIDPSFADEFSFAESSPNLSPFVNMSAFSSDGQMTDGRALDPQPSAGLKKQFSSKKKAPQTFGWLVGASLGAAGPGWAENLKAGESSTGRIPLVRPMTAGSEGNLGSQSLWEGSSRASSVRSLHHQKSSFLSSGRSFLALLKQASSTTSKRSFLKKFKKSITFQNIKKKRLSKPTLTSGEILSFASDRSDYWAMRKHFHPNQIRVKKLIRRVKGFVKRRTAAEEALAAAEYLSMMRDKEAGRKHQKPQEKTPLSLSTVLKMKAFARAEIPSIESEQMYMRDLRNHRDIPGEKSRGLVAALFGKEVATKAVRLRGGAQEEAAGLSQSQRGLFRTQASMPGSGLFQSSARLGGNGFEQKPKSKVPPKSIPVSAVNKLRKMLKKHRERLGWSIADLEEARDQRNAAEALAIESKLHPAEVSAHSHLTSGDKEEKDMENPAVQEGAPFSPTFLSLLRPSSVSPQGKRSPSSAGQRSSSPAHQLKESSVFITQHSPDPHSAMKAMESPNGGSSALASLILSLWKDAPASVRKILLGQHPSHFSPSPFNEDASGCRVQGAGIDETHLEESEAEKMRLQIIYGASPRMGRGDKSPSPRPSGTVRPSSRLSRSVTPIDVGAIQEKGDVASVMFEMIPADDEGLDHNGGLESLDLKQRPKSILARFDEDSSCLLSKPHITHALHHNTASRPASPKQHGSHHLTTKADEHHKARTHPSPAPTSSHAHSHNKGAGGVAWAAGSANLERKLLREQLEETQIPLPPAVKHLLEQVWDAGGIGFDGKLAHDWSWNDVGNEWSVLPSEILREDVARAQSSSRLSGQNKVQDEADEDVNLLGMLVAKRKQERHEQHFRSQISMSASIARRNNPREGISSPQALEGQGQGALVPTVLSASGGEWSPANNRMASSYYLRRNISTAGEGSRTMNKTFSTRNISHMTSSADSALLRAMVRPDLSSQGYEFSGSNPNQVISKEAGAIEERKPSTALSINVIMSPPSSPSSSPSLSPSPAPSPALSPAPSLQLALPTQMLQTNTAKPPSSPTKTSAMDRLYPKEEVLIESAVLAYNRAHHPPYAAVHITADRLPSSREGRPGTAPVASHAVYPAKASAVRQSLPSPSQPVSPASPAAKYRQYLSTEQRDQIRNEAQRPATAPHAFAPPKRFTSYFVQTEYQSSPPASQVSPQPLSRRGVTNAALMGTSNANRAPVSAMKRVPSKKEEAQIQSPSLSPSSASAYSTLFPSQRPYTPSQQRPSTSPHFGSLDRSSLSSKNTLQLHLNGIQGSSYSLKSRFTSSTEPSPSPKASPNASPFLSLSGITPPERPEKGILSEIKSPVATTEKFLSLKGKFGGNQTDKVKVAAPAIPPACPPSKGFSVSTY